MINIFIFFLENDRNCVMKNHHRQPVISIKVLLRCGIHFISFSYLRNNFSQ